VPDRPEGPRKYSLRITLSTLLVGLLILTVGGTVAIVMAVRRRSLDTISETIQKKISQQIGAKLYDRFKPAEDLLWEHLKMTEAGLIPIDDPHALSRYLAERIRYNDRFEWLGFIRSDGLGAGAARREGGRIVLILSRPVDRGFELTRAVLQEDGKREVIETLTGEGYDFHKAPWYAIGMKNTKPTWVGRYVRAIDGSFGWACAVSVRRDGERVGAFGVGFGLGFLEAYLGDLRVAKTGRVFLLSTSGEIRAGPSSEDRARLGPAVESAIAQLPQRLENMTAGETLSTSIEHGGIGYIVALKVHQLRNQARFISAAVIPEEELIGFFNRYLVIGLCAIGVLFVFGLIMAGRISKRVSSPLRAISKDLERIGDFEISEQPMPSSRIEEIAVVGGSVDRMKASLRSFGQYVPTELVRNLLKSGQEARLGGAMKNLTLFFSDVEGFTTVSEKMTPQSLVDALGEYLDVVTGVITKHHGVIDKYIGDGILSFFNAPHDDPHHAVHACLCAVKVQQALESRRAEWEASGKSGFRTRIGLHTGDVVVGNIGTPVRFSYTVIGDAVNLAARLESLNKAYGTWILASESTRAAAGDGFEWRRIDRTAVKGRRQGAFVFELLGERQKTDEAILRARDRHEAALDAYLDRRFEVAIEGFEEAAEIRPRDRASLTLRERAEMYLETPPPDDWDGVFVQTRK
jgi:adenylate cyclase